MTTKRIILLILLITLNWMFVSAQDYTGKELVKADNLNSLVETGIGLLFGAKDIEGEITKVTVTNDAVKKLSVNVEYTGFDNKWMKVSALDVEKTPVGSILSEPIQLSAGGNSANAELSFNADVGDEKVESVYLKLLICKKSKDVSGKVYYYNLAKQWKAAGLSVPDEEKIPDYIQEDLTLNIKPVPVGSASKLKDASQNTLPAPAKMVKVAENKNLYKSTITRQPMLIKGQMQVVQPATKGTSEVPKPPSGDVNTRMGRTGNTVLLADQNKAAFNVKRNPKLPATLQLNKEQIEKGAEGPGKTAIVLWDEILSDVDFNYGENQISDISTDIFPDMNENSGYYYYFPSTYKLVWNKDESYQLNILYGSGSEEGSGKVRLFAKLSPQVGSHEKQMVEELVKEYTAKHKLKFEKLVPMPLEKEPEIDLAGQLSSLYDIPAENVSASVSGLFDPIDVAWPMSTKNADDIMVGLKEIDLNGTLQLVPQGETPAMNIPVKISLDDENVLGRIEFVKNNWRNKVWKNEMPFPVRLKYIHALFLNKDEGGAKPYIYSWSLNDTEVPVLASVKFNTSAIPHLIDSKAKRIWVEYSVPDCITCKDDVINGLTGGTTKAREQKIEVTSYVKDDIGAHVIEVTIRSLYADPKGKQIIELAPVKLSEDFETYYISSLYVPEGKTAEYEYKVKIVTDDDIYRSDWIYSNEMSIDLNKSAIKNALGEYPGEE